MKTINEIKTDIDTLIRKQGNQGAIKLGDVLDDIVDIVQTGFQEVNNTLDKFKAQITNVATFHTAVPNTATEIVFAFLGDVDLTGYTKSGSIGDDIDVYANGTKYAVVSSKIICAPENSKEFFFDYSALTTLDLSNFDTSNVTDMFGMFSGCTALTSLDLSNFNTSNVTAMGGMFSGCSGLTTIIANDWSAIDSSSNMFYNCTSLVGGNGTTYDADHTDATYAHIDVADNPGYFTAPA